MKTKCNRRLVIIATMIVAWLLMYVFFTFAIGTLDYWMWTKQERTLYIFLSLVGTFFLPLLATILFCDNEDK